MGLVDSSLGAAPVVPVAADIITDPTGCKAKVRNGYRYGVYMPPPEGTFYYRIRFLKDVRDEGDEFPIDFTRGVGPLGFRLPFDNRGERKKSSINTSVVFDIDKDEPIEFPLSNPDVMMD